MRQVSLQEDKRNERMFSRADALVAHRPVCICTSTRQPQHQPNHFPSSDPHLCNPKSRAALPYRSQAIAIMPQTLYPRGTVKKIVKAHAARPLSKNVDILVRLSSPTLPNVLVL
jgi:hypothetical protein